MVARVERLLPGILVAFGLGGLWFVSSAGVDEGLLYGPGRWWSLFVFGKAVSTCFILFSVMALFALVLRSLIYGRRASTVEHSFLHGGGQ